MSAVMAQMGSMRRVLPAFRSFVRAIDMQTSAIRTGKDHVHRRRIIRVGTGVDKQPDKRHLHICVAPDAGNLLPGGVNEINMSLAVMQIGRASCRARVFLYV